MELDMKRYILFLLLLLLLPVTTSRAQGVTAVESLLVNFWPDYDQPAVLVLVSGTLPPETAVPAALTLPLPTDANLNAVAYVDENGSLINLPYTTNNGSVSLTTPVQNFRLEYYLPYSVNGAQHSFTFNWLSDVTINQFQAKIQQPTAAGSLTVEPAAENVSTGDDGLTYHILPTQSLPAGRPFAINVSYVMNTNQLTASGSTNGSATIDLQPAGPVVETPPARATNWPLIAGISGGVLIVVALILLYMSNRPRAQAGEPRAVRRPQKEALRYCHNCGKPIEAGDRYCRRCGAPVKGK